MVGYFWQNLGLAFYFDCSLVTKFNSPIGDKGILMNEATLQKEQPGNRGQIPQELRREFTLPCAIPLPSVQDELVGYPIQETDCFQWFTHAETFATEQFGVTVNLREAFPIPARLPWERILPIFIPAGLTHREMVNKALKSQGLSVSEGANVEEFTGASGDADPHLYLTERTPEPKAGRRLPPKFADIYFEGRQTRPLNFCGYGIGTGLLYKMEKTFLDPCGRTVSWLPEHIHPSSRHVACACSLPSSQKVWFYCCDAGSECGNFAFREALLLSPKL